MMRALAEFIMRGRWQAALVAAAGNLVPFVSYSTVGLVSLRKNLYEALLVLLWAALPLVVTGFGNGAATVVTIATIIGLALVVMSAEVLKATISWSYTMIVSVLGSALAVVLLNQFFDSNLLQIQQSMNSFFAEAAKQAEIDGQGFMLSRPMLTGVIAYILLLNVLLSLMVSRWWQALLYNPGGFKAEMHQLRLGLTPAVIIVFAVLVCYFTSPDYMSWAAFIGTPLLISGLCFFHFAVSAMGLGWHWLVLLYIGLVLFSPLGLVVVGVGFVDSLLNLRSRIPQKGSKS